MTSQELNFLEALETAKEVLVEMITGGLSGAKYLFAVSKMLKEKYNLNDAQSLHIIETALTKI